MAFTDEELAGFVASAVAEQRVRQLLEWVKLIERLQQLPDTAKKQWWGKVQAKALDACTWYCVSAGLDGIDRSAVVLLPDANTSEGRKITSLALALDDPEEFVNYWLGTLSVCMRTFVTTSRRCVSMSSVSGWNKQSRRAANRIANAIKKEIDVAQVCSDLLRSLTK